MENADHFSTLGCRLLVDQIARGSGRGEGRVGIHPQVQSCDKCCERGHRMHCPPIYPFLGYSKFFGRSYCHLTVTLGTWGRHLERRVLQSPKRTFKVSSFNVVLKQHTYPIKIHNTIQPQPAPTFLRFLEYLSSSFNIHPSFNGRYRPRNYAWRITTAPSRSDVADPSNTRVRRCR